jgi:hypothetical protein
VFMTVFPHSFSTLWFNTQRGCHTSKNRSLISFFICFSLFLPFFVVSHYLLSTYFQLTFPSFSAALFDPVLSFSFSFVRSYSLCFLAIMNPFLLLEFASFLALPSPLLFCLYENKVTVINYWCYSVFVFRMFCCVYTIRLLKTNSKLK